MAHPQQEPLRPLTPHERATLELVARSGAERADRVSRAKALLAVADGATFVAAAHAAGRRSGDGVAKLVARCNVSGLAALTSRPGGRPPVRYGLDQAARILHEARRPPDREADGTATWSLTTLQRALRRAPDGLPDVSTHTIRRVLHEAGLSWQENRTWCATGTVQRQRKAGIVPVTDPATAGKKGVIERAYTTAEALGIPLWCQDEAGPYQAVPQPGASWQPVTQPAHRPHEYVRGGTAKLLTLFRPASGEVRACPVERAPNAVLHPWLKQEIATMLAALPPPDPTAPGRMAAAWEWRERSLWDLADLPPVRLLLIWDNLAGHQTPELLNWLVARGVWPLFTPLGGSWLNLAESVQRIIVRRALAGQHPRTAQEVMAWLATEVAGWNGAPTPFAWGGQRAARRQRARERRHALGGSGGYTRRPIPRLRRPRYDLPLPNGYVHVT